MEAELHAAVDAIPGDYQIALPALARVANLRRRLEQLGPPGVLHGNAGRAPANKADHACREHLVQLVQQHYADYNFSHLEDTLAREHGPLSTSTAPVISSPRAKPRAFLCFYLTNDEEAAAEDIVFSANDRCNQENQIAQLRSMRALHAPVDTLLSNAAYMLMTALAWNLKAWLALSLPETVTDA